MNLVSMHHYLCHFDCNDVSPVVWFPGGAICEYWHILCLKATKMRHWSWTLLRPASFCNWMHVSIYKGQFTWVPSPTHVSKSQHGGKVPSPTHVSKSQHGGKVLTPTHVSKSQHGGKVPTFEPQEIITIKYGWWTLQSNVDYFMKKYSHDSSWELSAALCSILHRWRRNS